MCDEDINTETVVGDDSLAETVLSEKNWQEKDCGQMGRNFMWWICIIHDWYQGKRTGSRQRRVYVSAGSSVVYIKNVFSVNVPRQLDVTCILEQASKAIANAILLTLPTKDEVSNNKNYIITKIYSPSCFFSHGFSILKKNNDTCQRNWSWPITSSRRRYSHLVQVSPHRLLCSKRIISVRFTKIVRPCWATCSYKWFPNTWTEV